MQTLTRAGLLRSGAAAALAASGAGILARGAAADAPPDADLAFARLLVASDLLAADFYTQALAAKQFGASALKALRHAAFNEQEHYTAVAAFSLRPGRRPPPRTTSTSPYPAKAFADKGSIAKLGVAIEQLQLGAYLGAADAVQSEPLRGIATRIAANEAQHLSLFTGLLDDRVLGVSLPAPLGIGDASNALGAYRAEEDEMAKSSTAPARPPRRSGSASTRCAAGTAGPHPDGARHGQPAPRPGRRDRPPARRRRAAPERSQPLQGHRHRGPGRGADGPGRDRVTEPVRVFAIVTRDAVEELGLKAGMPATAIVKATSVMVEQ